MQSIASRPRHVLAIVALSLGALIAIASSVRAQDLSATDHKRMEEMLSAVRRELVDHYYDSTMGGLNLAAVYDSAVTRLRDAHAVDAALSAIAWLPLELHDSHTFFVPPQRTVQVEYGWEMAMIGDSCYVTRVTKGSDADVHGVHPGDQLLGINGYPPTRDDLWQLRYLFWLLRPQRSLHVVMRSPGAAPHELELESKVRERSKIIDFTGADGGSGIGRLIRDGEKEAEEYRAVTVEYGNNVLVWKMPTFETSVDEVHGIFGKLRGKKTLVLDLRGNGGGYEKLMLEVIGKMSRDSVVVGKERERKKVTTLVAKGSGNDAFTGDLYVLVDSRSASASEIFARIIQLTGRGKVLGDRTAGAVMRARFHPLQLGVETKVLYGVQVTEADVVMADGNRLERVGVTPDVVILPTAEDIASKRDPVLARALTLAGMPTDASRAGSIYPAKQ